MYTQPAQQQHERKHRWIIIVVAVVSIILIGILAFNAIFANAKEQGAASIRTTILNSALQCAAIEGSFPTNLAYLEENYDLRVNHDDYVVIYEVLASNALPSVVVVPR